MNKTPFSTFVVLGATGLVLVAVLISLMVTRATSSQATQSGDLAPVPIPSVVMPPPAPTPPEPAPPVVATPKVLEALGVAKPSQVDIHWTAYYVTPAKLAAAGKGRTVTYTDLSGKTSKIQVTEETYNQGEVEAAAVGVDKNGVEHFAYRVGPGVWKELPQGCAGMGNKLNALVPLMHVAAEQKKFPFGSMIFCPIAVGLKLGGEPLDGYFWISDVGSGVTGNHFDLFVGNDATYKDFTSRDAKPTYPTTIYRLPAPPKDMDPRTDDGLAAILRSQGFLKDDATPEDKYKTLDALLLFQQAEPEIPAAEYGNPRAATTLWFLIQAAYKAKASK